MFLQGKKDFVILTETHICGLWSLTLVRIISKEFLNITLFTVGIIYKQRGDICNVYKLWRGIYKIAFLSREDTLKLSFMRQEKNHPAKEANIWETVHKKDQTG